jgi:mannose-1-phosphate guanylyltransferase
MDFALIMAGGSGTRLWPLSRENRPKQAIDLIGDQTMFQLSVSRLAPLFQAEQVFVVTRREHVPLLADDAPALPRDHFIVEPEGRGTAPAIGLAALHLRRQDPEAVMAVLTADHYIARAEAFRQALSAAIEMARKGYLVTLGITPTAPATGYGYIEQGEPAGQAGGLDVFRVLRFTEKPDRDAAEQMVRSGRFSWNSGMFIWKVSRILEEFERQMPEFYAQLLELEPLLGTPEYEPRLEALWPAVAKQTIDYGVMEGARDVVVVPVEMGWSDVGSWGSLPELLPADEHGNNLVGKHLALDVSNTLVFAPERLVALIGVHDLIVVDAGDALLVCHKNEEQRVREIVDRLKQQGRTDLL